MAAAQAHALLHTATLPYPCPAQSQPMATPCVQISRRGFLRGAEPQPGAQFFHGKCDSAGVFGKFPKIAPGGARGDSFVRCHVKVIRLFRNFTPRSRSSRSAALALSRAPALALGRLALPPSLSVVLPLSLSVVLPLSLSVVLLSVVLLSVSCSSRSCSSHLASGRRETCHGPEALCQ